VKERKQSPGRPPSASLAELVARLNRKRRDIVRPVLENPREFVLLTVRDMARRLDTDPATTVRIVRGMGFHGYRQFQAFLHELSIAHASYRDTMGVTDPSARIPDFVRRTLDRVSLNLHAVRNSLDADRVAALARRIYRAKRIVLFGGDLAASLVAYLEHYLVLFGLPAVAATTPAIIAHTVRSLGPGDVVIAISFRRGLRQTVVGVQLAKSNGAYCVGITDTFVSPLARFAHECFVASVESASFGDSYVAPLAVVDVILAACVQHRRAHTMRLMKRADQEKSFAFRWYSD
jgi:RpiR family transcriptional regulator, carbohydrate utilization regulator